MRVNNREYQTETEYETEDLAQNAAAARAYMICRNFSVNDGMYPGQRQGQGGVLQGLPVAIGTGRRSTGGSSSSSAGSVSAYSAANAVYDTQGHVYVEAGSGPSSPRSSDSELDVDSRRGSRTELKVLCYCGRGTIRAYDKCSHCLRERGWR